MSPAHALIAIKCADKLLWLKLTRSRMPGGVSLASRHGREGTSGLRMKIFVYM